LFLFVVLELTLATGSGKYKYIYHPNDTTPKKNNKIPKKTSNKQTTKRIKPNTEENYLNEIQMSSPSQLLPDIFIGWFGEEEYFGFLRIDLDSTLEVLRREIQNKGMIANKYNFVYKKVPVLIVQETTMFVRECVVQNEDGYFLKVKHTE